MLFSMHHDFHNPDSHRRGSHQPCLLVHVQHASFNQYSHGHTREMTRYTVAVPSVFVTVLQERPHQTWMAISVRAWTRNYAKIRRNVCPSVWKT